MFNKIDIDLATNLSKQTALHLAARKGHAEILQMLLDKGADPNKKDSANKTALDLAISVVHKSSVTILLDSGKCDLAAPNGDSTTLKLAKQMEKMDQNFHDIVDRIETMVADTKVKSNSTTTNGILRKKIDKW